MILTYLNLNHIEALAPFALPEKGQGNRLHIQGVYVDHQAQHYVATDGRVLGAIKDVALSLAGRSVAIKTDKDFLAMARRARKHYAKTFYDLWLAIPDMATLSNERPTVCYVVSSTDAPDLTRSPIVQVTLCAGMFPQWLNVLPRNIPDKSADSGLVQLDASLVSKFTLGADSRAISLIPTDSDDKGLAFGPIYVLVKGRPDFLGLIMPMRYVDKLSRERAGLIQSIRERIPAHSVQPAATAPATPEQEQTP